MRHTLAGIMVSALGAFAPPSYRAQSNQLPTTEELAAITERGRLLAAYDVAAWHATDAVLALRPPADAVNASAARRLVLETRRMHTSVLDGTMPDSVVAGYHTAVLNYLPEDSDVFLVLRRRPARPEFVVSSCCYYEVRPDGTITWRPRDE